MPSSFAWLDYSEDERQRMLDAVDLFKEKGTRDEMGIGSVRDACADLFFPGTSTIQTRARYFLFVPWVYLQLEQRRVPSSEIAWRARDMEIGLIDALAVAHPATGSGVIGVTARASLQRLPSNIYWQGLRAWNVRTFGGSLEQYHRYLDRHYRQNGGGRRAVAGDSRIISSTNWYGGVPAAPESFPNQCDFRLRPLEADYLRERIMTRQSGSLLAFLVDRGLPKVRPLFPWAHPQLAELPPANREQLAHARNFSELIHGAPLLYNLMLAEKAVRPELVAQYRSELTDWSKLLKQRAVDLGKWNRARFWQILQGAGARVAGPTRVFIEQWWDIAVNLPNAKAILSLQRAQHLVGARERYLKGKLSRLESPRALELWNGAAGTGQLDFRWSQANTIIDDIVQGQTALAANA